MTTRLAEIRERADNLPTLDWKRDGNLLYTLVHDGWRKGVEQFKNDFTVLIQRQHRPESETAELVAFVESSFTDIPHLLSLVQELGGGAAGLRTNYAA